MPIPKPALASLTLLLSAGLLGNFWRTHRTDAPVELHRGRLQGLSAQRAIYVIRRGDKAVGYTTLAYEPTGDSLLVIEESEIRLPAPGGMVQHAIQRSRSIIGPDLELARFAFEVVAGDGRQQQKTHIDGVRPRGLDSLDVTLVTGDQPMHARVGAPKGMVLGSGIWPVVVLAGQMRGGTHMTLTDFDPTTLHVRPAKIEIGTPDTVSGMSLRLADEDTTGIRDRVVVYPITQTVGGITYQLTVTDLGLPKHATLPLGLSIDPASMNTLAVMRQQWKDDAGHVRNSYGGATDKDAETLIAKSAIQSGHTILGARTARQMVVRAWGAPLPLVIEGGSQHVRHDTVIVTATPLPARGTSGYMLPDVGRRGSWYTDSLLGPSVRPEPFIESDRPEIVAMARDALRGERDPAAAADSLTHYVFRNLTKSYTASIPSAVEVARARSGDCNEHTVLTVALARAAGLPARPVAGVVYVDGAFYFHAWVEVWLANRWVPIDPTFGLSPADPARLRLAAEWGDIPSVIAFLGTLKLDVLNTK